MVPLFFESSFITHSTGRRPALVHLCSDCPGAVQSWWREEECLATGSLCHLQITSRTGPGYLNLSCSATCSALRLARALRGSCLRVSLAACVRPRFKFVDSEHAVCGILLGSWAAPRDLRRVDIVLLIDARSEDFPASCGRQLEAHSTLAVTVTNT